MVYGLLYSSNGLKFQCKVDTLVPTSLDQLSEGGAIEADSILIKNKYIFFHQFWSVCLSFFYISNIKCL